MLQSCCWKWWCSKSQHLPHSVSSKPRPLPPLIQRLIIPHQISQMPYATAGFHIPAHISRSHTKMNWPREPSELYPHNWKLPLENSSQLWPWFSRGYHGLWIRIYLHKLSAARPHHRHTQPVVILTCQDPVLLPEEFSLWVRRLNPTSRITRLWVGRVAGSKDNSRKHWKSLYFQIGLENEVIFVSYMI